MNIEFTIKEQRYLLQSEEREFSIAKPKSRKGIEEWSPCWFFGTLEAALSRILSLKVSGSEAKTLKELKSDLETARKELTEVWNTEIKLK